MNGQVRSAARDVANHRRATYGDEDPGADEGALTRRRFANDGEPMAARGIVPKQRRRLVEVRYEKVEVSVVVIVAGRKTSAGLNDRESRTGVLGHVLEVPPAHVLEQQIPLPVGQRISYIVHLGIDVSVGHGEIQVSVVVEVGERRSPRHGEVRRIPDACLLAHVLEEAAAGTSIEGTEVFREVGHEDVQVPVAVDVSHFRAHARLRRAARAKGRSGPQTDLFESALAVVAIQVVGVGVVRHVDVQRPHRRRGPRPARRNRNL